MLELKNQDLIADANCDQATPVETAQVSLPWGLLGLFSAGTVIVFPITPHCWWKPRCQGSAAEYLHAPSPTKPAPAPFDQPCVKSAACGIRPWGWQAARPPWWCPSHREHRAGSRQGPQRAGVVLPGWGWAGRRMSEQAGLCWPFHDDGMGLAGAKLLLVLQQQEAPATWETHLRAARHKGSASPRAPGTWAMARAAERKMKGNRKAFLVSAAHCKQQ